MRPPNERPSLLLADGAPVRCRFYAWGERGSTDDCQQDATVLLDEDHEAAMALWQEEHPRRIVGVWPGRLYLCDRHERIVRECAAEIGL